MIKMIFKCSIFFLMIFILMGANKLTLEDVQLQLQNLPENKCETFQCDIQMIYNGEIIGNTKMYKEGTKHRIEIKSTIETDNTEDMIIVGDSASTYTKTKDGWIKGEGSITQNMDMSKLEKNWVEILAKKDVKLESVEHRKAILQFKETENVMGVGNGRVCIDLETGNLIFFELQTPMGTSQMIFEYEKQKGYSYMKKMKMKTINSDQKSITEVNYNNVKVNAKINQNLFKVDNKNIIK